MVEISDAEFDHALADTLDRIPPKLANLIDNVVILVENDPPPGEPDDLLGLYDGIPLTERGWDHGGDLPDRITIYRQPLKRHCSSIEELTREIEVTVIHEIAHHFGIDDDKLHELGWA